MAAFKQYYWDYIAPGGSVSVFIHGYGDREAVAYSLVVYAVNGVPVYSGPRGSINLTQGDTVRHVDGTMARTLFVRNNAGSNPCAAALLIIAEWY